MVIDTNIDINVNSGAISKKSKQIRTRTYSFLLPNCIKYRITQTEKLIAFRFNEYNKANKVSVKDAINYIKTFPIDKVHIAINMNVVPLERKHDVIEGLDMLVQLKDIMPRRKYVNAIEILDANPNIDNTLKSKDENVITPRSVIHDTKSTQNNIEADIAASIVKDMEKEMSRKDKNKDNTKLATNVINTEANINVEKFADNVKNLDNVVENKNEPEWVKLARETAEKAAQEIIDKDRKS
jgi:hypothetical protein